jgi:beta-glucosidase/6-phospho-beta-glucosidase/beta-galactosidase
VQSSPTARQRAHSSTGRDLIAGFESTYLPAYGVDSLETTGHDRHWQRDLEQVFASGVRQVRYPLRWQRIGRDPHAFDFTETDRVLGLMRDHGAVPIVDLVHHTTYPDWLHDGFRDRAFGDAYLRYAEAVATRYPWLEAYTLFNEPFATLFLAGHEALWPPYDRGVEGFVRLLRSVLPAVSEAAASWRELLPQAKHVWVDTAEHHRGVGPGAAHATTANDRRHVVLDLALGHDLDRERPFLRELLAAGGEPLLELPPLRVDVLGLDYYCHSEWYYDEDGSHAPSPNPVGLAAIAEQYGARYGLPMMVTETNVRGTPSDRASWLRHTLEQYELAVSRGVDLRGYCWFPQVDSCDWDSLLARSAGRRDPVGVVSLAPDRSRVRTTFTDAWEAAACGTPASELPAYRFQSPCDEQLTGLLPFMSHWNWVEPPAEDQSLPLELPDPEEESADVTEPTAAQPDLVVLSHLRWIWVFQRPQHIVSRLAKLRAPAGARTWFVEEPVSGDVDAPTLRTEQHDGVTRVWLVVPRQEGLAEFLGFDAPETQMYGELLAELLGAEGRPAAPDVWLYTPMAFELAQSLEGGRLIYDVMDDLSSFSGASPGLRLRQRRLLDEADIVFTGGRSLHRSASKERSQGIHLFPSGVETSHYAAARALRRPHDRQVAGYVGVVDERIDLDLLRELSELLPDWCLRIVGPITKIDEADVPRAHNIEYVGLTPYDELPRLMAGFDVALMPFALNESTRSISPTKTLEYLAAGLPVVSTRVPDVVADYSDVVHLADDGVEFAAACREVVGHRRADRDRRVRPIQERQEWDYIAGAMATLLNDAVSAETGLVGAGAEATA